MQTIECSVWNNGGNGGGVKVLGGQQVRRKFFRHNLSFSSCGRRRCR